MCLQRRVIKFMLPIVEVAIYYRKFNYLPSPLNCVPFGEKIKSK